MEMAKHFKTVTQKLFSLIKKHPTSLLGIFFLALLFLPSAGYCDIGSAFTETKSQVQSVVSNKSGLFWIFMAVILGSGIWALFKGSWKGVGIALLIGIILGNFSGVIDAVLNTKIFKNESQNEQNGKG
ncbi:MAG: hypothetical protein KDK96_10815 [Chlamydiia bacterium]|nr:hypothetical protein [Chlamydiia bacterium]